MKDLYNLYSIVILYVILRRRGYVDNPQGGVRGVIPLKQHYIRKKVNKF